MKVFANSLFKIFYPHPLRKHEAYTLWGTFSFFILSYFYLRLGVFVIFAMVSALKLSREVEFYLFADMISGFSQALWMILVITGAHILFWVQKYMHKRGTFIDRIAFVLCLLLMGTSGESAYFGQRFFEKKVSDIYQAYFPNKKIPQGPHVQKHYSFVGSFKLDKVAEKIPTFSIPTFEKEHVIKEVKHRNPVPDEEKPEVTIEVKPVAPVAPAVPAPAPKPVVTKQPVAPVTPNKETLPQPEELQEQRLPSSAATTPNAAPETNMQFDPAKFKKGETWRNLAGVYFLNGNCEKADHYLKKSVEAFKESGRYTEEMKVKDLRLRAKFNCK